jgi:hypothetical protein
VSTTQNSLSKSLIIHSGFAFAHIDQSQVLRYSALLFGVFYGFTHQRTLYANSKAVHAEHEYKHKEALIQKAKAEFAKKNLPQHLKTADGGGESLDQFNGICHSWLSSSPSDPKRHLLTCPFIVITNPDDKNFDLEAYLNYVSAEST